MRRYTSACAHIDRLGAAESVAGRPHRRGGTSEPVAWASVDGAHFRRLVQQISGHQHVHAAVAAAVAAQVDDQGLGLRQQGHRGLQHVGRHARRCEYAQVEVTDVAIRAPHAFEAMVDSWAGPAGVVFFVLIGSFRIGQRYGCAL